MSSVTVVRRSRAFYHVNIDGKVVEIPVGIGEERLSEEDAIFKAKCILVARSQS